MDRGFIASARSRREAIVLAEEEITDLERRRAGQNDVEQAKQRMRALKTLHANPSVPVSLKMRRDLAKTRDMRFA